MQPGAALAQAWLPDNGTISYALTFNDTLNREHYLANGDEIDVGHTRARSYGLLASYSPTDRLMLVAGIPYIRTRYWGPPSHGGAPEIRRGRRRDPHRVSPTCASARTTSCWNTRWH